MKVFGSSGAGNVRAYMDPASILNGVLRNVYSDPSRPYQIVAQWGETRPGAAAGVSNQGTVTTLTLSTTLFRTPYDDIWDIGERAGPALQYVYQAMTLLHELGHIYNLYGNGMFGGSSIVDRDFEESRNLRNMQVIFNECAAAIFSMPKEPL